MHFFGLSKVIWQVIFLASQIIGIGLIVLTLISSYWFDQFWEAEGQTITFKGSLLGPNSDIVGICSTSDTYKDCKDNCYSNFCHIFDNWYNAGVAYIIIELFGIVMLITGATIVIVGLCNKKYLRGLCNLFLSAFFFYLGTAAHLIAFIVWAGSVKFQFSDCSHSIPYNGIKSVCGQTGANLALGILFFLFPVAVIYYIVGKKIRISERERN